MRTWKNFVYVAFVIDVFSRTIVGWKASTTAHAEFVLEALDQALYARRPPKDKLIHHSDRGSQYLSIKYTEKLAEAGILKWLGLFGQVNRFYKWMTAGFMPQPGLVGAG